MRGLFPRATPSTRGKKRERESRESTRLPVTVLFRSCATHFALLIVLIVMPVLLKAPPATEAVKPLTIASVRVCSAVFVQKRFIVRQELQLEDEKARGFWATIISRELR